MEGILKCGIMEKALALNQLKDQRPPKTDGKKQNKLRGIPLWRTPTGQELPKVLNVVSSSQKEIQRENNGNDWTWNYWQRPIWCVSQG